MGHDVVAMHPGRGRDKEIHDPANPLLRSLPWSTPNSGWRRRLPGTEISDKLGSLSVDGKHEHRRFEQVQDPVELVEQARIPRRACVSAIANLADDNRWDAKRGASRCGIGDL